MTKTHTYLLLALALSACDVAPGDPDVMTHDADAITADVYEVDAAPAVYAMADGCALDAPELFGSVITVSGPVTGPDLAHVMTGSGTLTAALVCVNAGTLEDYTFQLSHTPPGGTPNVFVDGWSAGEWALINGLGFLLTPGTTLGASVDGAEPGDPHVVTVQFRVN